MFVHVVNFWLKEGLSAEDRAKFEEGVSSLKNVEGIEVFNVGKPAATDRPVIDRSYDYCLLTVFKDEAAHDVYQVAPIHLKFVETCKQYWDRVLIYDSESI
ncbi:MULTISPECIES: Dabb family protein [unclassified Siphonobacter]|uniref:Dabb family protein n=1 Tax=unclassified Siphonobacter TaxID=2635712 RepID=UPI000CC0AA90|nr:MULTISPECIES: Dabb family protein [unclassified Siphonobacter]MDQ1088846.1 heme-degrading monooxygenase HmoA [Siphonobacter sp. SORGH_AS_1065]MDR6195032.1 heme-degrading monooxygenase HmoA [Siphonobacter sp. SORGH_AS_0500]PKK38429.1 transcription-repair coupling factor [Siphonobacter sp. SORGH_AS_0500]